MGGEGEPPPEVTSKWLARVIELERKLEQGREWVMCSTCCGLVWRRKRRAIMPMPNPDDDPDEVVEDMLTDANEMRAAAAAAGVMLKLPLVNEEPDPEPEPEPEPFAFATEKQLEIIQMRRRMMMEQKRCPTCYRPVSEADMPPEMMMAADAGSNSNSKRPNEDRKEKKKKKKKISKKERKRRRKNKRRSKNKNERSKMEEEARGVVASEGEAMIVGSREEEEEGSISMGRTAGGKSSNMLLAGKSSSSISMGHTTGGMPRTKIVTARLSKDFVQGFIQPPTWPFIRTSDNIIPGYNTRDMAEYKVKCVVYAHHQSQCDIKGYVDYQDEVTDDEEED